VEKMSFKVVAYKVVGWGLILTILGTAFGVIILELADLIEQGERVI